jgi:hypothetical protein
MRKRNDVSRGRGESAGILRIASVRRICGLLAMSFLASACIDSTEPPPAFDVVWPLAVEAPDPPGLNGQYDHVFTNGLCTVRIAAGMWRPVGGALLTMYGIERSDVPDPQTGDTWRGSGMQWSMSLDARDTERLFVGRNSYAFSGPPSFQAEITVQLRHPTGFTNTYTDFFRCREP